MSCYTEFFIQCELSAEIPELLKDLLHYLVYDRTNEEAEKRFEAFRESHAEGIEFEGLLGTFLLDDRWYVVGNGEPSDLIIYERNGLGHRNWFLQTNEDGSYILFIGGDINWGSDTSRKFMALVSPWITQPEGTKIGYACTEDRYNPSPVIVGQDLKFGDNGDERASGSWFGY